MKNPSPNKISSLKKPKTIVLKKITEEFDSPVQIDFGDECIDRCDSIVKDEMTPIERMNQEKLMSQTNGPRV